MARKKISELKKELESKKSKKAVTTTSFEFGITRKEFEFLSSFSETVSIEDTAKDLSISLKEAEEIAARPAVAAQLKKLSESFSEAWRLSAKQTAGRHMALMDKLEKLLDSGDTKVASSLAKMSSDALKATGHFDQADGESASQVSVSINIGSVGEGASVSVGGEFLPSSSSPSSELLEAEAFPVEPSSLASAEEPKEYDEPEEYEGENSDPLPEEEARPSPSIPYSVEELLEFGSEEEEESFLNRKEEEEEEEGSK